VVCLNKVSWFYILVRIIILRGVDIMTELIILTEPALLVPNLKQGDKTILDHYWNGIEP